MRRSYSSLAIRKVIELSAEELSEVVRRYRRAAVGDVLGDASQSAEVVTFTRRKPGPRSR